MASVVESVEELKEEKSLTIDEYVELLKSELASPKGAYAFNGLYDFNGKTHDQKGLIFIDKNLDFAGEIIDRNSRVKKYAVKGKIIAEENMICMRFDKIPPGIYSTIHYQLDKETTPERFEVEGICGNYDGAWSFYGNGLDIKKNEYPDIGTGLEIKGAEQSNKAGISLYRLRPDIYCGMPIEIILKCI